MTYDLDFLKYDMINKIVKIPISVGKIAGHVAAEPFDKMAYSLLKQKYPDNTYRQYEYLNYLFSKTPNAKTNEQRCNLIKNKTVRLLLKRGKKVTEQWSHSNPFEEKQDDSADVVLTDDRYFKIIDVKTRDISKKGQPPNIISALKLAKVCADMIDNSEFNCFDIIYLGIDWELNKTTNELTCKKAFLKELFKSQPANLYINWAAALQIQFHVENLDQTFNGSIEDWSYTYLKHYVDSTYKRAQYMADKFAKPFEQYSVHKQGKLP